MAIHRLSNAFVRCPNVSDIAYWRASNGAISRSIKNWLNDLPPDVHKHEATVIFCFKVSVLMNRAFGGADNMTFSARCILEQKRAKGAIGLYSWATVSAVIDVTCAMLRGEHRHCETAYFNYQMRRRTQSM